MFKMSAISVETGRQTTPPLVDGVVYNKQTMTHAGSFQAQEDEKQQASRREFSVLVDRKTTTTTEDHLGPPRSPEEDHRGP